LGDPEPEGMIFSESHLMSVFDGEYIYTDLEPAEEIAASSSWTRIEVLPFGWRSMSYENFETYQAMKMIK